MKIANYLIKEKLSQGNNFTVYRAVKETDSTPYVLKILDKRAARTIDTINAAKHEYDLIKQIDSEYVIKAVNQIDDKDYVILELEDINGNTLKDTIKKQIPSEQFTELAVMIATGLADIHRQNIIHKDINPNNIIWNSQTGALKIIDFDISSKFDLKISHLGNPEKLQGTLPYISPEQTGRMNRTVDYRTDLYSLGVTFYEMLTGQLPFQDSNPMEIVYAHLARKPEAPHSINKQIPETLSKLVLKLLSKDPEERYQSADGLKNDLEKYREINRSGSPLPAVFTLGKNDFSGKLRIPEKFYGRAKEIEQLLNAFQRVCKSSKEMVLVAGYSGTGKTSLVNEMHKPITKAKGYFVSGKFDQFQRTIPYFAFIQAFNQFCEQLLTEKQEVLAQWEERILLAVGNLGKVLTDMIPQLETVIGKQPDVPEVSGDEASKRFNYVFHNLFQAIATEKYPLVMFIDDLQWADLASLDLLKLVTQDRQNQYLLFIGAYRDNEVSHTHPLTTAIEEIRKLDMAVHTIPVKNLSMPNVRELLRDTLKTSNAEAMQDVASLTDLIYQKTQGNAFFTIQFIENLYREKLLRFDFIQSVWIYDIAQIEKQNITDNVVDLLVRKIQTLSTEVQDILKLASCIGNVFDLDTLSVISDKGQDELAINLETALTEHLIYPLEHKNYKFVHDRIHQAAYSLIVDAHKKPLHLKIGRLLLKDSEVSIASKVPKEIEQNIFEVVNHLNLGTDLIKDDQEKIQLAQLNLEAGQKAKISAAYQIAAEYVQTALRLLPADCWKLHYDLTLAVHNEAVQASYLCGNIEEMENFIEKVLAFSSDLSHRSVAYKHLIMNFVMIQNQPHRAVETLLNIFSNFGINITKEPTKEQTEEIFLKIGAMLDQKELASLKNLPIMRDPQKQLVMQLFDMGALAFIMAGGGTYPFVLSQMVDLVMKHGLTSETPHVLSLFGIVKVLLGDISGAYNLGKVAMDLSNKKFGNEADKYRSVVIVCIYMLGNKQHYKKVCELFMENYQHALNAGDFEFASSVLNNYIWCLSSTDTELAIINEKARSMRDTTLQLKQSLAADVFEIEIAASESLSGLNSDPAILDIDLDSLFPNAPEQITKFLTCIGHIKQIILAYFFNNYDSMLSYIKAAEEKWIVGSMPITFLQSDLYFYIPLAYLELYTRTEPTGDDKEAYLKKAKENITIMKKWADFGPVNFLHKYYLLQAELYRVTGKSELAAEFFDKAIETAYENEYINDAALANELAGKFYMQKNKPKFAALYFIEARNCYQKWGATAKVRHLEENYPKYLNMYTPASTSGTATASSTGSIGQGLDVASILKASQTLSGEVRLKSLLEKMMQILIENAGAQKGMLIENREERLVIQAQGDTQGVSGIMQAIPIDESKKAPLAVINYVARSKQKLVSDNISKDADYANDSYIRKYMPKSVVCFPMIKQGELSGIIYLENNLVEGVFTPARLEVLNLISGQIAISVENAQLYENLEDKVRQRTDELQKTNVELEKSREAADAANQAKSDFLANMSHEIRTPMNAVLGFTELLDALITDPKQKSYLGSIKSGGKSLLTLINDILDLSKIEAGKLEIRYEPVDPRIIFNEIEHIFSLKIARKNLDYSTVIDPQIPEGLVLDEVRLRQVLINLVGNAIKFTEHGFIKLTVNPLKPDAGKGKLDLRITVEDSGVGIPEAERESIFESFEQRKGQSRRQFGGTGLGLSICKRLVELMGGEIYADSEPGRGSAFKITLRDVEVAETDTLFTEKEQHADIIFEKCTILAVDDIDYNLNMIKEYFADTNVTVVGAENGEKAILYAREYKPDLIIMDLSMPVMDGYEATRHIKADAELRHIPVIVVTASSLQDKSDAINQYGFDDYMRKPISRAALFQKLSRFLKFSIGDESEEPEETLAQLIPPETLARLPEVITTLELDLMAQWKKFERIQPVKAVEQFGAEVNALGERYNLEILKRFGSDLTDYIHNFDIKSMQNRLTEFPDLINTLKSL